MAPEFLALSGADRAIVYVKTRATRCSSRWRTPAPRPRRRSACAALRLELGSGPLQPLSEQPVPLVFHGDRNPVPPPSRPSRARTPCWSSPWPWRASCWARWSCTCLERSRPCDPAQVEFIQDVAQQVALGMENARLFSALSQMASTDELTRLANRRRFTESLRMEMARMRRSEAPLSLIMADADHLKAINDAHGHPAGDAAIRHVAEAIRKGGRETDMAARLGGEEFALLLPGTDAVGAVKAAERIRKALASSSIPTVGTVTVSMGVATAPEDAAAEEELVRVADARLYAAKARGRNQVCSMVPSELPRGPADGRPVPES